MACTGQGNSEHERQPLHEGQEEHETDEPIRKPPQDLNTTGQSLIRHEVDTAETEMVSPYAVDPALVSNAYENPYKETTDTDPNFIRRVPSSDLVPAPFKRFTHVIILSYVSAVFFVFIGVFAIRLARNAKSHHSKGLYGLAQRDSKKAAILSYLSITLGVLLIILIIVVATST